MDRRHFLKLLAALPAGVAGCQYWPHEGFANDCLTQPLPAALKNHELMAATWEGIDTKQVWDCHCHLIGVGDSPSGIWINPKMQSLLHPIQLAQFKFYLDASVKTRAIRRFRELDPEHALSLEAVEADIRRRDRNDSTRQLAPLKPAADAVIIDSTDLTVAAVVETMRAHILKRQ